MALTLRLSEEEAAALGSATRSCPTSRATNRSLLDRLGIEVLNLADVRAAAAAVLDAPMEVRDWGLVESAVARPQASVFGEDAYATMFDKAAALMLSLAAGTVSDVAEVAQIRQRWARAGGQ